MYLRLRFGLFASYSVSCTFDVIVYVDELFGSERPVCVLGRVRVWIAGKLLPSVIVV